MTFRLKPLDGSPHMSDNCWQAVLDAVGERAHSQGRVRVLEWGAGNSTVGLVVAGLKMNASFEFTSVDHETNFFPFLAESVLLQFGKADSDKLHVSWHDLR